MSTQSTADCQVLDPVEVSDLHEVGIVFPGSNRIQVNNTTVYPYCTIGELIMKFPNGGTYGGTGVLIDRNYVLTCAHNLYGNTVGGWATSVQFIPARNGNVAPYGVVPAAQIYVTEDYRTTCPADPNTNPTGDVVDYTQYLYDYGLVKLSKPVDTGVMRMYEASDDELDAQIFNVTGYPGDKPDGTMWGASGQLAGYADEFLFYRMSTYKGQSGSSVITYFQHLPDPHIPRICGIHVAGSERLGANFAVRLTDEVIGHIYAWGGAGLTRE